MIDHYRHVPLRSQAWNESEALTAIEEIVSDALGHFDAQHFWPAHPLDDGVKDGHTSLYFGATGVIWGLEYLSRISATKIPLDFRPSLTSLMEANKAEFSKQDYAAHGSLLFGDLGTALLVMRLAPAPDVADLIYARANSNTTLPVLELMWGMPGSMIACVHMDVMTNDVRWRQLFATQASRLLSELEETANGPLWTQDLYGRQRQYLGPVHGFAGNMLALMRGWNWLTDEQRARIAGSVPRTLEANAWRSDVGATWPAATGSDKPPSLCQYCHGAPGMVITFADAPFTSPEFEALLLEGGRFTWSAGPLVKGPSLCHGTGGNGYTFLKLYRRTNDSIWLERAREFAMTAIAQCRETRSEIGRGRYSLWTGDIGLAVFLWDCIAAATYFPTIDVF